MKNFLIEGVKNNQPAAVRRLLAAGTSPDQVDACGETALTWAAHLGHTGMVKDLLAANANREARGRLFQATPVLLAAHQGHRGIVALLAALADVNAQTPSGATALMLALAPLEKGLKSPQRMEAVVRVLLEAGAAVNIQDCQGDTALMWAARARDYPAMQMLLQAGAGSTPPGGGAQRYRKTGDPSRQIFRSAKR